ncbi:MAG: hypothetical protein B7Z73_02200 [Planctomycetia bacterium 21-64-5]|nr:MAG: hypothetical protein B7Z73_02200 [Planctomycetia bacterium 21-64-5]
MAAQKLPAIFITDEHLLIGEVETRGLRLLEVLIDPNSEYVYLNDVHVARRESKASRLTLLKQVVVRKQLVRLAVLGGGRHEAPETRRFAFVDKKSYPAFLIVSGYEIEGRLQLRGAADPVSAMAHELKSFIPVTQAKIGHAGSKGDPLTAAVVLCNRDYISLFHIGEESPVANESAAALSR